jgi:murein DD-endopeptidase MepM/ murein hydrolase activator NlpD
MKRLLTLALVSFLSACAAMHPPSPYLPSRDGLQAGDTITVKPNENIYSVAREHNVSMRELIVLNNLKPPFEIRPGQSLVLPAGGGSSFAGDMKPPEAAPLAPVEKNALSPIAPAAVTSQPLDAIAPPPPLAPLPAPQSSNAQPFGRPSSAYAPPQSLSPPATPQAVASTEPVQALNRPSIPQKQVATTFAPAEGGAAAGTSETMSMVWPVQGPILSAFGPKGPGMNNDGVNIGAPKGAPVVAAAPGTVVYAGDEMKGFGNLVLIRHSNDWVTAYAHLDRILVKKDAIVDQGDMIGTVGKTGNVSSPQLHFETRQGGKVVDPATVVKGNL